MNYKFYYRFKLFSIDETNEEEIKKNNSELTSFACIENQLNNLKSAYDNQTKERADVAVNVYPALFGVTELSVYHKIRFKLFSRKIKYHYFCIIISKDSSKGLDMYFNRTENFNEVKQVFLDFINNYKIPDLSGWEYKFTK